jgi:hypothetical protein
MRYGPRLCKRRGTLAQKKAKIGRPKLPKGEAKGKIMPVRFAASEIRAIESAARVSNQSVSEWVRGVLRKSLQESVQIANQAQGSRSNDPRRIREGKRSFDANHEA